MKITVCIGSSCHVKGSQQVIEQLKQVLCQRGLNDQVSLTGAFCMGDCMNGVCVKINDTIFSVHREKVIDFFDTEVQTRLTSQTS